MSETKKTKNVWSRRDILKAGAATGVIAGAPTIFTGRAYGADYLNAPKGSTLSLIHI